MGDQKDPPRPDPAPPKPGEPRKSGDAAEETRKRQREYSGDAARTGGDPSDPGESGSGRGSSIPPGRDDDPVP